MVALAPVLRARLGSLLAIFPLGVWTVLHLWNNLAAFRGGGAWSDAVTSYAHPFAQVATLLVVLGPLLVHAVWGMWRLRGMRVNLSTSPSYTNLKYLLQRASAVGLLLFLGAHLWLALIRPRLLQGHAEPFADIAAQMHGHTPTLVVYVLGVLGTAFHLANGVHAACLGWGVVASARALARLEWVAVGLFVVLLAMGWGAVYALYVAGA